MPIDRSRLERRRRDLALDMAVGRIGERALLAAMKAAAEYRTGRAGGCGACVS